MRVLVCGGRDFSDTNAAYIELDWIHFWLGIEVLIEGDARGADRIAGFWARKNRIENRKFPADWTQYGRSAGPIRNREMLKKGKPDLVVAFPGGKGTVDMIKLAKAAGVDVHDVGGWFDESEFNSGAQYLL